MTKKLLAFDVSSSTIGWCILNIDSNNITYCDSGYIKPFKSNDILDNLSYARGEVSKILLSKKFDYLAIEDLVKFMPRTTATTVTVLASFNRMIGLLAHDYLTLNYSDTSRLQLIAPISVRHSIKKLASLDYLPEKKQLPDIIASLLKFNFPWEYTITKRNKKKIKEENFDVSDAICCGFVAATNIVNNANKTVKTKQVKTSKSKKKK